MNNQATGYASQHIWCLSQVRINWEVVPGRASGIKMVGMAEMGAPIRLDGVAVYPDCWCVVIFILHQKIHSIGLIEIDSLIR